MSMQASPGTGSPSPPCPGVEKVEKETSTSSGDKLTKAEKSLLYKMRAFKARQRDNQQELLSLYKAKAYICF